MIYYIKREAQQTMNLGKESETLEFKKTTGELKEAMVSISSILNKHGVGTLYWLDRMCRNHLFGMCPDLYMNS